MNAQQAQMEIDRIDAKLDAVIAALHMRVRCIPDSCEGYETARRRCPDLSIKHDALMRERGDLQLVRDTALNREYAAQQRRERGAARKAAKAIRRPVACTACNGTGYQAAA